MAVDLSCETCRGAFQALRRSARFCATCYAERRKASSLAGARRTYTPAGSVPLTCDVCARTWYSRANHGRWCSAQCRKVRHAERARNRYVSTKVAPPTDEAQEARWAAHVLREYDLTAEQWQALSDQQGGACALCRRTPTHRLRTDHCHKTGRVRGLLCNGCNGALGTLGDDEHGLQRALDYIKG